jgi:hypothetical protein
MAGIGSPEHREGIMEQLAEVNSITSETRFPNYKIVMPGGRIKWISSRAFPVRNRKGRDYPRCRSSRRHYKTGTDRGGAYKKQQALP